jgi:hypothetical protein
MPGMPMKGTHDFFGRFETNSRDPPRLMASDCQPDSAVRSCIDHSRGIRCFRRWRIMWTQGVIEKMQPHLFSVILIIDKITYRYLQYVLRITYCFSISFNHLRCKCLTFAVIFLLVLSREWMGMGEWDDY